MAVVGTVQVGERFQVLISYLVKGRIDPHTNSCAPASAVAIMADAISTASSELCAT